MFAAISAIIMSLFALNEELDNSEETQDKVETMEVDEDDDKVEEETEKVEENEVDSKERVKDIPRNGDCFYKAIEEAFTMDGDDVRDYCQVFIVFFLTNCTVLYCTVLYCTVLYCTVLYCTVLYCTVLYCTVLTTCPGVLLTPADRSRGSSS